jgi:hypothetical protein
MLSFKFSQVCVTGAVAIAYALPVCASPIEECQKGLLYDRSRLDRNYTEILHLSRQINSTNYEQAKQSGSLNALIIELGLDLGANFDQFSEAFSQYQEVFRMSSVSTERLSFEQSLVNDKLVDAYKQCLSIQSRNPISAYIISSSKDIVKVLFKRVSGPAERSDWKITLLSIGANIVEPAFASSIDKANYFRISPNQERVFIFQRVLKQDFILTAQFTKGILGQAAESDVSLSVSAFTTVKKIPWPDSSNQLISTPKYPCYYGHAISRGPGTWTQIPDIILRADTGRVFDLKSAAPNFETISGDGATKFSSFQKTPTMLTLFGPACTFSLSQYHVYASIQAKYIPYKFEVE